MSTVQYLNTHLSHIVYPPEGWGVSVMQTLRFPPSGIRVKLFKKPTKELSEGLFQSRQDGLENFHNCVKICGFAIQDQHQKTASMAPMLVGSRNPLDNHYVPYSKSTDVFSLGMHSQFKFSVTLTTARWFPRPQLCRTYIHQRY